MTNPLQQYFRHPELHIILPSKGRWWAEGSIDIPPNGELPVSSMSGSDDIAMRNADGLMNGDTTVRVVQSCFPSIKDAWEAPNIDMDTMFIAIRIASYGHQMDFETTCTACNAHLDYSVDLREVLGHIKLPNYDQPKTLDNLTFFLKPAPYKAINLDNQDMYQQQRAFLAIKNTGLTDDDREQIIKEALAKMAAITVNRLHDYIDKIIINDTITVTNKDHIKEFISNADVKTFNFIKDAVTNINAEYKLPSIPVVCDECGHADQREVTFDPASFFGKSS